MSCRELVTGLLECSGSHLLQAQRDLEVGALGVEGVVPAQTQAFAPIRGWYAQRGEGAVTTSLVT